MRFFRAPADAVLEVKTAADYVCKKPGGRGAVREVINMILKSQGLWQKAVNRYLRYEKPVFFKKVRNFFFYLLLQAIRFVVLFIPWRLESNAGAALGLLVYTIARKKDAKLKKNLDIVYGEKMGRTKRRKFIRDNFRNYGIGLFEFMKMTIVETFKNRIIGEGSCRILSILKRRRNRAEGVLCITAHYSNWEILPVYMAAREMKVGGNRKAAFLTTGWTGY